MRSLPGAWRLLGTEQRVAAVGCLLLIVSTFGPFTWVEVAEVLTALAVLLLLKKRAEGSVFHLPFGDGTAIAAAGAWCALLILVRFFDRSPGQDLLALACAALVFGAGMRERAKRPMDDLPEETIRVPRGRAAERMKREEAAKPPAPDEAATDRVPDDEDATHRIPRDRDATDRVPDDSDATRRIPRDRDATDRVPEDAAPTERISDGPDPGSSPGSRRR
ncbi:MAG TPA: hypothetical protein VH300_06205 [Thermoleophilaceae bacterium]|nr:hypothetical protein [Thermoleophilaceae bacterium]